MKTKNEIRKEILNIRNNLNAEIAEQKSRIIIDKIKYTEEYKNSKSIMVYMDFKNEVSTKAFITEALAEGKKVIIPYTNTEKIQIIPVEINSLDDLVLCKFGYLEPKKEALNNPYDIEKIELIIVPGVAFDKRKNRIGFGKGYYDKFLRNRNAYEKNSTENLNAKEINEAALVKETILAKAFALAYEFQVFEEIPAEEHDIKMDKIFTEENIYS